VATISSPANGSTLSGSTVAFSWAAAPGATTYQIWVGSTLGAHDLAVFTTSSVSATLTGLPTNGTTLFVKLWTFAGGVWNSTSSTYTTGP
jgi:hypothetical protein